MTDTETAAKRYCEDCRFFQPSGHTGETDRLKFGRCGNTAAQEPPSFDRFVSSKLDLPPEFKFAGIFREHGACGPDATLFEPKQPEPEQVAA